MDESHCHRALAHCRGTAAGTQAWLAATGGLADKVRLLPAQLSASDPSASPRHLAGVLRSHRPTRSANLLGAGLRLPGGLWPEPAQHAMVLPVGESAARIGRRHTAGRTEAR